MQLRNTAAGGIAGQAVTVASSGGASGDPYSGVAGTMAYVAGPAMQANAANTSAFWTFAGTGVAASRMYLRLLANPTAGGLFHVLYTGDFTTHAFRLLVNTDRQLGIQNAAGSTLAFLTAHALALNTWYRIEDQVAVGTTTGNGFGACQLYLGDSLTPLASYSSSVFNAGTIGITRADYGRLSGSGWGSGPQLRGTVLRDSLTPVGPAAPPSSFLALF